VGKLRYTAITSLDGYVADRQGSFDWAMPDEAIHAFVNDLEREVGTYLYGRRLYDVMRYWDTAPTDETQPGYLADYAEIWKAADKIVFSTTLDDVSTARTKLEPRFDPANAGAITRASDRDVSIGGPGLAAEALRTGLIDEIRRFVVPAIVGGGTPFLPDDVRLDLELTDERRFPNGTVYVAYSVAR
jgi:dihydrofolate reductase